ncbi:MAG: hypothetical protein AABY54_01525 [Deltaproteobacteria bacterium]
MKKPIFSNVDIYKAIVDESYSEMKSIDAGSKVQREGGEGWVKQYDPESRSFKKAMIITVFTGMWLEASLHLLIVRKFGEQKFKDYDFKSYRDKLVLLNISDQSLLDEVDKFKLTRKELVHEKAYFDKGVVKMAQSEAELAYSIVQRLSVAFSQVG